MSWSTKDRVTFFFTIAVGMGSAILSFTQVPAPWTWPAAGFLALLTLWLAGELWERVEEFKKLNQDMAAMRRELAQLPTSSMIAEIFMKQGSSLWVTKTRKETMQLLIEKIGVARRTVDAVALGYRSQADVKDDAYDQQYYQALDEALRRGVQVRRISWIRERGDLERLKAQMVQHKDEPLLLGLYETLPRYIPFISCLIVDGEEVHFGNRYLGYPISGSYNVACRQPDVVDGFKGYFEALWRDSTIVKEEKGIREKTLHELEARLSATDQPMNKSPVGRSEDMT